MSAIKSFFCFKKPELKLWLYVFAALIIVFLPLLLHFIWGNHDWQPLIYDNHYRSGLIEGRFSQYVFLNILLMGKILPILNILLGLALYTLALVLLYTRFFEFELHPHTALILISVGLLPYINEILYFQFIVFSQLSWPLIIVLSLICCKKASSSKHFILYTIAGFLILLFAIGGYPATANLFVTATTLWLITQYTSQYQIKHLILKALPFLISLIFSFLCLYIIYGWLMKHNLMMNLYNNQTMGPKELILNIFPTLSGALHSLIQPQPFFSLTLKSVISGIFLLYAGYEIYSCNKISQKITMTGLFIVLLICLKFSALLTKETSDNAFAVYDPIIHMVRTDFYTIPCLILVALAKFYQSKPVFLKNITFITALILIILSTKADLYFIKTQKLGFIAEDLLQQRLNNRLQENPAYKYQNLYTVVQAGELPLRTRYYQPSVLEKYGYYTLQIPYGRHWIAFEYYNFFEPTPFVREGTTIQLDNNTTPIAEFITQIAVWPNEKSIYMDNNKAIIALTPKGKKMLIDQFKLVTGNTHDETIR